MGYLRDLREETQTLVLGQIFTRKIPCVIVSRNLAPTRPLAHASREANVPLIRSPLNTKDFTAQATVLLEERFARG